MRTQIIYVVVSTDKDVYLEQAWASAYSVKLFTPTAHIVFMTDESTFRRTVSPSYESLKQTVDEIIPIPIDEKLSNKERSRWIKTNLRNLIRGDFLFIDTDTIVTADISEIDELQDNIAAVLDFHCQLKNSPFYRGTSILYKKIFGIELNSNIGFFNSGVLYVKDNQSTHDFYTLWHLNWLYSCKHGVSTDQPSLAKTNDEFGGYISELDGSFNCQVSISIQYLHSAKIIHFFNSKWNDPALNPFYGKDTYMEIKERGIDTNIHEKILRCKDSFASPSKPMSPNETFIWFDALTELLKWIYKHNSHMYRLLNLFSRVVMRIIKYLSVE